MPPVRRSKAKPVVAAGGGGGGSSGWGEGSAGFQPDASGGAGGPVIMGNPNRPRRKQGGGPWNSIGISARCHWDLGIQQGSQQGVPPFVAAGGARGEGGGGGEAAMPDSMRILEDIMTSTQTAEKRRQEQEEAHRRAALGAEQKAKDASAAEVRALIV
jgi:hypothetical protein